MTDFNQKTHDTNVGSHGGQSRQMMEVFENQEFGSIRLLQEAGKTFFCASDVAKALGYVNPYAAVKRHCRGPLTKREGVVQKVNQYGDAGEQVVEISFITEGDVYRLIVTANCHRQNDLNTGCLILRQGERLFRAGEFVCAVQERCKDAHSKCPLIVRPV